MPPSEISETTPARDGAAALATWVRRRAAEASRVVAVEEALLAGQFTGYAARRLLAFGLARGWGIALHIVEFTWLAEVFSAKPLVASLALQNFTLVAEAIYWGVLESLRRRVRELGEGSESAAVVTRWLTGAMWVAFAVILVPVGRAAWVWHDIKHPPTLFDVYALVCAVRLGADMVLRTYYSGVFAHRRVHRPIWSAFVGPLVVGVVTLALWNAIAGWSFAVALLASAIATRGLLFVFTRRAYRVHRTEPPRLRLGLRGARPSIREVGEAALAGLANTATRLGSVVLLAAVIPSLTSIEAPDGTERVEPFAYALHLAAPLVLLASQWSFSFYHDWKRLEDDEAQTLARHLYLRLVVAAVLVGLVSWAGTAAVVRAYVPLDEVTGLLVALLPSMLGLSIWTAVQLRSFAHGEFLRQLASALAMVAVLWATLASTWAGPETSYIALGAGPWAAIFFYEALGLWQARHGTGVLTTLAAWTRALAAAGAPVVVWQARVLRAPTRVAERVAAALGPRGAVVRTRTHVVWFERAPTLPRTEWLAKAGGQLMELEASRATTGRALLAELEAEGRLGRPDRRALDELRAAHARAFPGGFMVELGRRPPPAFRELAAVDRQTLWRDALRSARGIRGRSRWNVAAYAPDGALEAFFVAPRIEGATARVMIEEFRAAVDAASWRIARGPRHGKR